MELMGVESPSDDNQAGEDLVTLQNTLDSEAITFVDRLSAEVETVIEDAADLQRYEYVIGDVSDYGVSSKGHAHFELIHDETPIHCVIYTFRLPSITVDIENGMQVAVKGKVSFYTDENYCSIITEDVVDVGTGIYQQTYEENKRLLAEDGLLDAAAKQQLPSYPRCIGIVTSARSDAREDAVTSIHDHHSGVDIIIQGTSVQGDTGRRSMMQAIGSLDEDPQVDVIVLTRGGGADKHLRIFNDTALCRVVHRTSTPIVVGVGHEADQTLAGEVADQRVMTPTDVGVIAPDDAAITEQLTQTTERLDTAYTQTLAADMAEMEQRLDRAYNQHVTGEIADLATRLEHAHESFEQQKIHEREQAEAAQARRRQRIALTALAVVVLLLLGYIIL